MNETNETNETNTPITRYQIGGQRYRLEPLSWQQQQWLGEYVFKDADIAAIDYGAIHDFGRKCGPLFMAICLIREDQTRKQKSLLPMRDILTLAEEFRGELSGMEVASFCTNFFFFCPPGQMAMLMPGRAMQRLFVEVATQSETAAGLAAPGGNGSSTVSSPSPTGILLSSGLSDPSSDQPSPIRISGDGLSISPPSEPSLVSAG